MQVRSLSPAPIFMENPMTWGPVQIVIASVLEDLNKELLMDPIDVPIGYSPPSRIYYALKEAGLLKEAAD